MKGSSLLLSILPGGKGADQMILAGPFDTKEEAESRLSDFAQYHEPFVWGKQN
jgi:hypothetical protein